MEQDTVPGGPPETREQPVEAKPAPWRHLLVAGWALAEATLWPVMPDAVLAPLAGLPPSSVGLLSGSRAGVALRLLWTRTVR